MKRLLRNFAIMKKAISQLKHFTDTGCMITKCNMNATTTEPHNHPHNSLENELTMETSFPCKRAFHWNLIHGSELSAETRFLWKQEFHETLWQQEFHSNTTMDSYTAPFRMSHNNNTTATGCAVAMTTIQQVVE